MNKKYFTAILVLLMVLAFWALRNKVPSPTPETAYETGAGGNENQADNRKGEKSPSEQPQIHASNIVLVQGVPIPQDVIEHEQKVRVDPAYDWKQTIDFYGKVVDESNQPIAGASVDFTWSTALASDGTLGKHQQADAAGNFAIHEIGKRLYIDVSKQGYYSFHDARNATFEYADPSNGKFTPDPATPVVFHLRKKGPGADLITSRYGVKSYLSVPCPPDGSPVRVDLLQRKSGGEAGPLVIGKTAPPYDKWKEATEWAIGMKIPEGGFLEIHEEFPYEAPETGYQPLIQFEFKQGQTNWTQMLEKNYYIKFGSPPRYGRMRLETQIEMQGARLTYAINPDGSRNLEPK